MLFSLGLFYNDISIVFCPKLDLFLQPKPTLHSLTGLRRATSKFFGHPHYFDI